MVGAIVGGGVQPSGGSSGGGAHVSPGARVGSKKIGADGAGSTGAGIAGAGSAGIIGASGTEAALLQMTCAIIASNDSVKGMKITYGGIPL